MQSLHIVSAVVTVRSKNRFLLVQRSENDDIFPGKWQSPGGKVEFGEVIEEAARRELLEETGIDASNERLHFVMSYSWQKSQDDPWRLGIIFLIDLIESPTTISLDKELQNCGWFSLQEAAKLNLIGQDSPTGTLAQLQQAHIL